MRLFSTLQYWLVHLVIAQFYLVSTKASWSSVNPSTIQLLGLFTDALNTSQSTSWSVQASAMFKAAVTLSRQYDIRIDRQLIGWQTAATAGNVINALSSSCLAVSTSNIVGIVGPHLSREAHIIANFATTIGLPVISYSATDLDLSDRSAYPTFYRTVPSDERAAKAIAALFLQYNWTSCTIVYQNDAFGLGGVKALAQAFYDHGLNIGEVVIFDVVTGSIRGDLKKYLVNSPARVVVVWVLEAYTTSILQSAVDSDVLGPRFTWILSSSPSLETFNTTVHNKLIGILTVEPLSGIIADSRINVTLRDAAYEIWKQNELESFPGEANVNSYALFAFDATWALILALQQSCSAQMNSSECVSFVNSSFCFERHFLNSRRLLDTINSNVFLGVSGLVQFGVNTTDRVKSTYYYSQNIRLTTNGLTYVPVLVWSDHHDWMPYNRSDFIIWPGNSFSTPSSNTKAEGIRMKILIVTMSPFTIIPDTINQSAGNTIKYTGYVPELIDLLQSKMHFNYDVILKPANLTYTQSVAAVARGEYDMFIGDVTINTERREIADFSTAIFDDSLRIVVRKQMDVTVDLLSFLRPFTPNLWLAILAACVYSTILIFIYEREENTALKDISKISSVAMSGWYSIGTLMGYGVDYNVRTAAGRLVTTALYILSLILVATYTANLASNLTLLKSQSIISGIDDIKNGKIPLKRVGIRVGTTIEEFFLREISNGDHSYYPLESRQELIDSLLSGTVDAAFVGSAMAEYITKRLYCNLTIVGASFSFSSFGIVTPKNWIYGEELDVNIISFRESGALDELRQKWFSADTCPPSSSVSTSIGVEALGGLFMIFSVITILSWFLFAWRKRLAIKTYVDTRTCPKTLYIRKNVIKINRVTSKVFRRSKRPQTSCSP